MDRRKEEEINEFLVDEDVPSTDKKEASQEISEEYFKYVYNLVSRVHVLEQKQLVQIMRGKFPDYPEDKLLEVVLDTQKNNYILISKDGYVMTEAYYKMITNDKFGDGTIINNYYFRIKVNMKPLLEKEMPVIKCMSVVADTMPVSQDFFLPVQGPWTVAFVTPEECIKTDDDGEAINAFYYEVIYIPHASSTALCLALEQSCGVKDKHAQKKIKRIAVLEDADDSYKIPQIGFTNIVTVCDNGEIEVIEKRTEPWK